MMPNHVSPFVIDNVCKSIIVRRGMDSAPNPLCLNDSIRGLIGRSWRPEFCVS